MAGRSGEYVATQDAAASQSGDAVGSGCAECHTGNWIHVRYEYTDDVPVTDAVYVVQEPNNGEPGGRIIAEGPLTVTAESEHDYVHVDLGSYDGEVEVYFYDDPEDVVPYEEPSPVEDERWWFQRAADATVEALRDAASWAGGTLAGDFNEDMTSSQIIANTVLTMVPGIDQVGDLRDLVAHAKMLIWDERWNDRWVWVGVVACLIGLIPTLGSLAKGIIRLAFRNLGNIGEILVLINRCADRLGFRINGVSKIREVAQALVSRSGELVAKFNDFMDMVAEGVRNSVGWFNRGATDRLIAKIEQVKILGASKIPESAQYVSHLILDGLARAASTVARGRNRMAIRLTRSAVRVARRLGPYPAWLETMARAINKANLEAGARSITPADRARFLRLSAQAEVWADDLLAQPNLPNIIRSMSRDDVVRQMKTFGSRPTLRTFGDGETMDVYRVISNEGQIPGGFWSRSMPPDTEEAWRARDAVMNEWNDGGAFVKSSIPPPEAVLIGEIGPQDLGTARDFPKPDQMLEGGGEQIWIPRHADGPQARVDGFYHTNWNNPSSAIRTNVHAGNPNECDL